MDAMKQCAKCKKILPYSDFYRFGPKVKKPNKDGYYSSCKKCENKRSSKWKKKNYDQVSQSEVKRRSGLIGYLKEKYLSVQSRSRKYKKECNLTWFDFLRVFITQMRVTNFHCMYNPKIKLTHEVGNTSSNKLETNISIDRLDNEEWYTMNNIVFCCWKENNNKRSINFDTLAMLQMWALWLNKEKWEESIKRAQNYLDKMTKLKPQTLRSIRNEMEQALPVSEVDTGNDWEQTTLFD